MAVAATLLLVISSLHDDRSFLLVTDMLPARVETASKTNLTSAPGRKSDGGRVLLTKPPRQSMPKFLAAVRRQLLHNCLAC
jgi:hypothetical protein